MSGVDINNYRPYETYMSNLVINRERPNMSKVVIIENPQLELDILKKIAALDGKPSRLVPEDIAANPKLGVELLGQLQGMHIYKNDSCPLHDNLVTYYDLDSALQFLTEIRNKMGAVNFSNSKVVFEELLLGLDFRPLPEFKGWKFAKNEPNHHVIMRAYNIPKNASLSLNPSVGSLSRKSREVLLNLQLYNGSDTLISWTIEHPDRELRLLQELAGADGDMSNVSNADMRSSAFQTKLRQLEGYRLYTNDPGEDATQADLNAAYAILSAMSGVYDLAHIDVLLGERTLQQGELVDDGKGGKVMTEDKRWLIQEGHVVLNEDRNFADFSNFGF
jgi:hypothetical protein